jgi:type IV secretory pathway TraG/TraD family ATPase VirD4
MLRAVTDMLLAVVGYVVLGTAAGIVLRSSVAAVVIGFAYLLPVENVITAIVSGSARWLPGQSLEAVAGGGAGGVHYGTALMVTVVYVGVAAIASLVLFVRRDVTA